MKNIVYIMAGFILGCFVCALHRADSGASRLSATSDTAVTVKTVRKDSLIIRYVTMRIPRQPSPMADSVTTVRPPATDTMSLPITRKHYQDSTFEAWVSGYAPSLDSIILKRKETVIRLQPNRRKAPRLGLGIQIGYGLTPGGPAPYVGLGIHYRLTGF